MEIRELESRNPFLYYKRESNSFCLSCFHYKSRAKASKKYLKDEATGNKMPGKVYHSKTE